MYEDKLKNLQERLDAERLNNAGSIQEVRELTTKITALTNRNVELESVSIYLTKFWNFYGDFIFHLFFFQRCKYYMKVLTIFTRLK